MNEQPALTFSLATTPADHAAIARLNYSAFVEEIPQHHPNAERRLVDRFDADNTYFVCKAAGEVVGMVSVRTQRPFSLDGKLPDLDSHLPPHVAACEIRLLTVTPEFRHSPALAGLLAMVGRFCETHGYDLAVISGALRQLKLYTHLGFEPFGPVVGTADAPYQPMLLRQAVFDERVLPLLARKFPDLFQPRVNLLPGPVEIAPAVAAAWRAPALSHRGDDFLLLYRQTRTALCRLAQAEHVSLAVGAGTLANDLVAAQLTRLPGRGLVVANGEFGERLADHARRMGLTFDVVSAPWGEPVDQVAVATALDAHPRAWLWGVQAETSTGVLNDVAGWQVLCAARGVPLCLDCISALGVVPVDLRGVRFASGVSGKGLGAYAGLALVFHDRPVAANGAPLPRCLDLSRHASAEAPYTMPSGLFTALHMALGKLDVAVRAPRLAATAGWLRAELRTLGLPPLAAEAQAYPGATTIPLPASLSAEAIGRTLEDRGFLLSYRSPYLLARNWLQVCLMRDATPELLTPLIAALREIVNRKHP